MAARRRRTRAGESRGDYPGWTPQNHDPNKWLSLPLQSTTLPDQTVRAATESETSPNSEQHMSDVTTSALWPKASHKGRNQLVQPHNSLPTGQETSDKTPLQTIVADKLQHKACKPVMTQSGAPTRIKTILIQAQSADGNAASMSDRAISAPRGKEETKVKRCITLNTHLCCAHCSVGRKSPWDQRRNRDPLSALWG